MQEIKSPARRDFMVRTAALAAASSLPMGSLAQEGMASRAIPGTDEHLPIVGLGSPQMFYTMPEEGPDVPKSLIQTMYDLGGRIVDTPAHFRPDPPVVGGMIQEMNLQDELFLAGKITVDGREAAINHLDITIENLGKRPLDLMLLHNLRDFENTWPVLTEAKAEGKVRYIGVSEATTRIENQVLEDFMKAHNPDFIMPAYSMHQHSVEERILPMAADMGIAVIAIEAFKVVDDGAYFSVVAGKELPEWAAEFDCDSWAQFSLKYVLSNPAVTAVATETSKPHHVVDNMHAGYGRLPDEAMRKRMSEHFFSLL